jgi:hypothetical protein
MYSERPGAQTEQFWDRLPYVGLVARLVTGEADSDDACAILGEPAGWFVLGSHYYERYPNYGIDVVSVGEDSRVVAIRRIPPRIPATVPAAVRRDLRELQGSWALAGGGEDQGTGLVFEGNLLTISSAGIAPSVCYRIDPSHSPKTMHFYLPDPDDDRAWRRQRDEGLPRKAFYRVDGDRLQLWFDAKKTKHEPADMERATYKRIPLPGTSAKRR